VEFTRDDYVVRTGWRGVWLSLLGLLGWIALSVGLWLAHWRPGAWRDLVLLAVGAALLAECLRRVRLALQRKVVFAVHSRGIYFGDGPGPQDVPWSRICAVELFKERIPQFKSQTVYHCIGVRSPGTRQVQRPGNGPAAQPVPDRSVAFILGAGRPDLIPGHAERYATPTGAWLGGGSTGRGWPKRCTGTLRRSPSSTARTIRLRSGGERRCGRSAPFPGDLCRGAHFPDLSALLAAAAVGRA
jgi:hypothetical protein